MLSPHQIVGLYLSACYVALPVVCLHLWRRGWRWASIGFFLAPITVWFLWQALVAIPVGYQRIHLVVGVLPALVGLGLSPIVAVVAANLGPTRLRAAGRTMVRWSRWMRPSKGLVVFALAGAVWFGYGLWFLPALCLSCPGSSEGFSVARTTVWFSSAAGTWPAFLALFLAAAHSVRTASSDSSDHA